MQPRRWRRNAIAVDVRRCNVRLLPSSSILFGRFVPLQRLPSPGGRPSRRLPLQRASPPLPFPLIQTIFPVATSLRPTTLQRPPFLSSSYDGVPLQRPSPSWEEVNRPRFGFRDWITSCFGSSTKMATKMDASEALNMSLDDIIKRKKKTSGGRGRGRGRGAGRGTNVADKAIGKKKNVPKIRRKSAVEAAKMAVDVVQANVPDEEARLVVSNLSPVVTDKDVRELFSAFGPFKSAGIHYDAKGRSKGVAEVVFKKVGRAEAAMLKYNNALLDGRPLKIEMVRKGAKTRQLSSGISVVPPNRAAMAGKGARASNPSKVVKVTVQSGSRGGRGGRGGRRRGSTSNAMVM